MTAAALAAALLLVGATSAWAAFVPEGSPYTVGDDPLSLNAGDFNGDGRPDVATINGTSVRRLGVPAPGRRRVRAGGGLADHGRLRAECRDGRRLQRRRAGGPRGVGLRRGQRVGAAAPAGRWLRTRGRRRRSRSARASTPSPRATSTATDGSTSRRRPRQQPGRAPAAQPQNNGFRAGAVLHDRADPGRDRRRRLQRRRAGRPGDRQPGRRQRDDPAAGRRRHVQLRDGGPRRRRSHRHRRRRLRRQRSLRFRRHQRHPGDRLDLPAQRVQRRLRCGGRRSRSAPRRSASTPPTSTATAGPTSPWPRTPAPSRSSAATPAAASRATSRSRSPAPSTTSRRPTSTATRGPTWPPSSYTNAAAGSFSVLLNPAPALPPPRRRSPARPSTSSRCPAR